MTTVYHELLPESYLLILAPGQGDEPEKILDQELSRASRSGKRAVWVDCQRLHTLSTEGAGLLCAYHQQLAAHGVRLVLTHVSEPARQQLLRWAPTGRLCIVPTLLDAAQQPWLPVAG